MDCHSGSRYLNTEASGIYMKTLSAFAVEIKPVVFAENTSLLTLGRNQFSFENGVPELA